MNILFTLCGRAGSKGFKDKNIKSFLGIPLIYYSMAAIASYCTYIATAENNIRIVLNTDSEKLITIVKGQNEISPTILRRDLSLSGDAVPKVEVIRDCLVRMESIEGIPFDIVVDLDITSPLRTLKDVCNAVQKKIERKDTDVVFSVTKSRRNPYFNMVKKDGKFYDKAFSSNYTMRQQAPEFFDMNASIYAYSVVALKNKSADVFFNDKCDVIFMKDTGFLDIDSEEDFELMQVVANYLFKNDDGFKQIHEMAKKMQNGQGAKSNETDHHC